MRGCRSLCGIGDLLPRGSHNDTLGRKLHQSDKIWFSLNESIKSRMLHFELLPWDRGSGIGCHSRGLWRGVLDLWIRVRGLGWVCRRSEYGRSQSPSAKAPNRDSCYPHIGHPKSGLSTLPHRDTIKESPYSHIETRTRGVSYWATHPAPAPYRETPITHTFPH